MRFGKETTRPCDGEHRVFRRFLWWLVTISGVTRWLEYAALEYRYARSTDEDEWVLIKFINP
jgi:hypothetical protein